MAARSDSKGGELIQIIILTLFITSGFLALASLVFGFLIPAKERHASAQIADMGKLVELYNKDELKTLRDSYERFKQEATDVNLRDLINTQRLDLTPKNFRPETKRNVGSTVVHVQTITFEPASLQSLVNFLARVSGAHQAVRVEHVSVNRRKTRRADTTAPSEWDSNFTFVLYENPEVMKEIEAQRKIQARREEAKKKSADANKEAAESSS